MVGEGYSLHKNIINFKNRYLDKKPINRKNLLSKNHLFNYLKSSNIKPYQLINIVNHLDNLRQSSNQLCN